MKVQADTTYFHRLISSLYRRVRSCLLCFLCRIRVCFFSIFCRLRFCAAQAHGGVEVSDWLRSIAPAYAQYCAAFAENGMDGSTVLELEHEELKLLGVTNVLHRIRLMVDIKRHRSSASITASSVSSSSASLQPMTPRGKCCFASLF